jgi:hypothetical protein
MPLTGEMIFHSLPHAEEWDELQEATRMMYNASAMVLNQRLDARSTLQKKVLTYLLKGLRAEVQDMSCDEFSISGLTAQERLDLTEALYTMSGEEWDEVASDEFSLSSLCQLALTWVAK